MMQSSLRLRLGDAKHEAVEHAMAKMRTRDVRCGHFLIAAVKE